VISKFGGIKLAAKLREPWIAHFLVKSRFSAARARGRPEKKKKVLTIFCPSTTVLRRDTGRIDVTSAGLVRAIWERACGNEWASRDSRVLGFARSDGSAFFYFLRT
jgi:hypothetical protein